MPHFHWNPTLTDRQRVLLHTQPLMLMRYHWLSRDENGISYDPLCLSMKLFDVIIDHSGFGSDVVRETVDEELRPLLRSIDAANDVELDDARHERVIDRLIGGLMNDSNRGESFTVEYADFDANGAAAKKTFGFKLLREVHGYSGEIALELSSEAINLFLNALDLDIESEQIATDAVIQFQLQRGNFDKAKSSAETARARSLQYEQKIHRVIEQAKRDIRRVNWREDVHLTLLDANQHVDDRLREEEGIVRSARDKLDALDDDDDNRRPLLEVIRLLKDCVSRHLSLSKRLMTARSEFIEQQSRQYFIDGEFADQINLRDALLGPLLSMSQRTSTEFTDCVGHTLIGPGVPRILSVGRLITWQLQPKREQSLGESPIEDLELVETNAEIQRLDSDALLDGEKVFAELEERTKLSDLLDRLDREGCPISVQDAVTMQILDRFDPEDESASAPVAVEVVEVDGLKTERCCGDDLLIVRLD